MISEADVGSQNVWCLLQEGLGLNVDAKAPLVACITRLVPQKGVHLIRHALFHTRDQGGQVRAPPRAPYV